MRRRILLTASFLLAFAPGCIRSCGNEGQRPAEGEAEETASASASASPAESVPPPNPERLGRGFRHGGLVGLLMRTSREAATTPEQKNAIVQMQQDLRAAEPPLTPLTDYQNELAAEIKDGKLDPAKLAEHYKAIDQAVHVREEKQGEAIQALYGALDPSGRQAVATSARGRVDQMFRPHPEVQVAGGRDAGADAGEPIWFKRRIARAKGELALDEAQVPKVTAILTKLGATPAAGDARREATKKHAEEILDAFEKDGFDVKRFEPLTPGGAAPHQVLEAEAGAIGQILPLLTPEQRERLAGFRSRRALGHWLSDADPWSGLEEFEPPGGPGGPRGPGGPGGPGGPPR